MLSYNHSLPFGKAYIPIYPTFYIISSHVDALWHTFGYGGLRCLSESRGGGGGEGRGSHETKFVRNAIQYSEPL